ncbi:MAG: aminopeptidase P family protein [Chloroflexi bacterium]|nr:aminopeptidase P family protein [Chloroflexota bacterium]
MSVGKKQSVPSIAQSEFEARIARAQELMRAAGLDALLVHSSEADQGNVRYFSDYWPLFECAGVLIPADGEPALLVGPESGAYAHDRSKIRRIYQLLEYREPAEPDYPGVDVDTFEQVFLGHCGTLPKKVGIGGWALLTVPIWQSLQSSMPATEFVRAEDIMVTLRQVKSPAEIECIAAAFRISERAMQVVLDKLRPGASEYEMVGVAQKELYFAGAEYEGHALYVLSGLSSAHAISRPTAHTIREGEMVQLNIGARVSGYSSSVGRPAYMGRMPASVRELVEFGLEAHHWTVERMQPGTPVANIAEEYDAWVKSRGYGEYLLYGPCHSIGIIEVEAPWVEKTSTYELQPGMVFQVDTFFYTPEGSCLAADGIFGLRWEDGLLITEDGNRLLSSEHLECIEISN